MRICLVSRELYPVIGGGIAPIVSAAARQLSEIAEVVVVSSGAHREAYERLRAASDPRVLPEDVDLRWVEEPENGEFGGFMHYMHAYSSRVHDVLRGVYGERGPDVIEFCDYLGEGFVTIQARHTMAAWLRDTLVCVRLHTTTEFCAVLDGYVDGEFVTEALFEAERYCLRRADRLLWSGGDVLDSYRRYYGAGALAEGVLIPDAFLDETGGYVPDDTGGPGPDGPVRLLYLGRAERRKGIHDLVRALIDTGREDWRLTLIGGDTDTGPLGTSLMEQLRLTVGDDPRVRFGAPVPRGAVGTLIREHDVVVVPSRWECWPNVAREALQHNRPILATPVGGLCGLVRPGISGWLADGIRRRALRDAVARVLDDPEGIVELIHARGPRGVFDELTDADRLREGYRALAALAPGVGAPRAPRSPRSAPRPLVSVVVPYFRMEELIETTLDSVAAQTYPQIETIVVNDGSLRPEDHAVLARVARREGVQVITQANAGLGVARNFGISQASGDYILPLDSDDVIVPEFVARLVSVLEGDPDLAYVGTWVQYMDEDGVPFGGDLGGYMPYGNWSSLIRRNNVGGVCTCLFRREIFDAGFDYDDELTSYEDWLLMRELAAAGLWGAIVPERLFLYRVRTGSMMRKVGAPRLARLEGEVTARQFERAMRWPRHEAADVSSGLPLPVLPRAAARSAGDRPDAVDALREANAQLAAAAGTRRGAAAAAGLAPPAEAR